MQDFRILIQIYTKILNFIKALIMKRFLIKLAKNSIRTFSSQANVDYMKRAGFKDITTIFKYICFEGFLAIK